MPMLVSRIFPVALTVTTVVPLLSACGDKDDDTGDWVDTGTDGGATDGGAGDGGTEAPPTEEGCEERHADVIAAFEAELASYGVPAASFAIMEDGVVTCRVARGTRGGEADALADIETLFQLGSTTKMFTALGLLQKVEDGAFALDSTLAEVYPDSEFDLDDSWNDALVMEDLLTHRGAFYDYLDPTATGDDADLAEWHDTIFFPYLWLMADPGWYWNYANPNFDVAGLVVEAHDDRWFADVMREDVWGPLGMDRTYQRRSEVEADGNYALGEGYIYESKTSVVEGRAESLEEVPDASHARPAGYHTWSTPTQQLAMARFLMEGDGAVLDDTMRQAMTAEHAPVPIGFLFPFWSVDNYGYGVMTGSGFALSDTAWYELEIWNHGGNTNLYTNDFYMVPSSGFAIAVMSAGYGTGFYDTVTQAIGDLVALPTATALPALEVDAEALAGHVGVYDDAYNVGEMIITLDDDGEGLNIEMPLLESLGYVVAPELTPLTTDVWIATISGSAYDLTFHPGPVEGESEFLANRLFVGQRVPSDAHGDGLSGQHSPTPSLEQRQWRGPAPWETALRQR